MTPEPAPFQVLPAPDEFLANQSFLRRLARELIRDAGLAEDLLQDTWLAWRERRPAGLAEPRAWLTRVLQNRARNARREEERRARRERLAARPEADHGDLTRATVGVQAEVVAVLQGLDEPLQTALVLRYFHGLAPGEIAVRTGVPLNTAKARLTRGLARMREELDRRHARDRRAWARCLLPLALTGAESGLSRPDAGNGPGAPHGRSGNGRGPIASWLGLAGGVCALLVLSVLAVLEWSRRTAMPGSTVVAAGERRAERVEAQLVLAPPPASEPADLRVAIEPVPAPPARIDLEWPQFARNAAHDAFDPKLEDRIRTPAILWRVPDAFGQPTLSRGTLYSGGRGLFRIDARSGQVLARVLEPEGVPPAADGKPAEPPLTVVEAPAIAGELVLARLSRGGAVTAFDRELMREVWSWKPEAKGFGEFPGCLAGGLYVVPLPDGVAALRVADGQPAWTVATGESGGVNMVPASAEGRVFFGTEHGVFWCVDLADGHELWRVETGGWLGWTSPVVVKDRVVFADRGSARQDADEENSEDKKSGRGGEVHCLAVKDGKELWHTSFGTTGFSTPGVGPGYVVGGFARSVVRFDLAKGKMSNGVSTGQNAFGSPSVVGESLVFGNLDGNLYVHDLEHGSLRWRFHLAEGKQAQDFVHAGDRLYLSTTDGLYCLGDDGSNKRAKNFVLESTAKPAAR